MGDSSSILARMNEYVSEDFLLRIETALSIMQDADPDVNVRGTVTDAIHEIIRRHGINQNMVDAWGRANHRRNKKKARRKVAKSTREDRKRQLKKTAGDAASAAHALVDHVVRMNVAPKDARAAVNFVTKGEANEMWASVDEVSEIRRRYATYRLKIQRMEFDAVLKERRVEWSGR